MASKRAYHGAKGIARDQDESDVEQCVMALLGMVLTAIQLSGPLLAQTQADDELQHSVEQLRHVVGTWSVVTEFLNADGRVVTSADGTYDFTWVVPDRVVQGRSEIPELGRVAGILFYLNAKTRVIEMVSVGADGQLWVMSGPLGEEIRQTKEFAMEGNRKGMLRFVRFNVGPDRFESRMEYTEDGGKTWTPGNHQVFRRVAHE